MASKDSGIAQHKIKIERTLMYEIYMGQNVFKIQPIYYFNRNNTIYSLCDNFQYRLDIVLFLANAVKHFPPPVSIHHRSFDRISAASGRQLDRKISFRQKKT